MLLRQCYIVILQEGKIAGRAVLIAGQPGTGKTAIAMGMHYLIISCYTFDSFFRMTAVCEIGFMYTN